MKAVEAKPKTRAAKVAKVIFHPGQIKQAATLSPTNQKIKRDLEILNPEWRREAERICQDLAIKEKPLFQEAAPLESKIAYSLPSIEVRLPGIAKELINILSPREHTIVGRKDKLVWNFSLAKKNAGGTKSEKTEAKDGEGESGESSKPAKGQVEEVNKYNMTVKGPNFEFPVKDLTAEEVCEEFTEYLGRLLRYGTFPLDKKASEIYGTSIRGNNFAALRKQYKDSLDRGVAKIYEILDKFVNGGRTLRQLNQEYPEYSFIKLVKLVSRKDQLMQGLSGMSLDDYIWNDSAFCQVFVDLKEKELKVFEQAIKELKAEDPDLLKDFEFTIVNPNSKATKGLALNAAHYIDNFISNAEPQRTNIIVIGNPFTDYEEATSSSLTQSGAHGLNNLGFLGFARVWGVDEQKILFSRNLEKLDNFVDLPFMNIVGFYNKAREERLSQQRVVKKTEKPKSTKSEKEEDLTPVDYKTYAQAGLHDIRLGQTNEVAVLKQRLLALFNSQQLAHSVLQQKISPELKQLINQYRSEDKPNKSDFEGNTAISLFLWLNSASCTNIDLKKIYNDQVPVKRLLTKLLGFTNDPKLRSEIAALAENFEATIQTVKDQTSQSLETLIGQALPLFNAEPVSAEAVNTFDQSKVEQLAKHLATWKFIPWTTVLKYGSFTEEFNRFASASLNDSSAIVQDQKITEEASNLVRADKVIDLSTLPKSKKHEHELAIRMLVALKDPQDILWQGAKDSRRIPLAMQAQSVARALINLGVIDCNRINDPKPVLQTEPKPKRKKAA